MQALIVTHKKKTAATRKWTEKNWYNVQNNSFIVFLWQQQEQKKKQNQCCTREDNFSRRFIVFQTYTCSYNACYTGYSTRYFQLFVNLLSFYSPIKYFRVNQKQMKGGHCYVCSGETACVQHTQHNSIQCTCCVVVVSLKLTHTHYERYNQFHLSQQFRRATLALRAVGFPQWNIYRMMWQKKINLHIPPIHVQPKSMQSRLFFYSIFLNE